MASRKVNNLKIYNPKAIRRLRKINLRKLTGTIVIAGALVFTSTNIANHFNHRNYLDNHTVSEIMQDSNSDILNDLDGVSLAEISTLEKYLSLSETLHDMDLDINYIFYNGENLMSPDEISELINIYKESKEGREKTKYTLAQQEGLVNSYIALEGYQIVANACLDAEKAILADAKEEKEGTVYNKDDITIPREYYSSTPEDSYSSGLRLTFGSDIELLQTSLYDMQTQNSRSYDLSIEERCSYNQTRNEKQTEALRRLKEALSHDYTANKSGKVVRAK